MHRFVAWLWRFDGMRKMHTRKDSAAIGWPDCLHMVPGMAGGVRGEALAYDATGRKTRGAGCTRESARIGRRIEGRDGAAACANAILDAVKDGAEIMPGLIRWALKHTGDL
jgi:hypothetical protein